MSGIEKNLQSLNEVIVGSSSPAVAKLLARLKRDGRVVRLAPRLYSTNKPKFGSSTAKASRGGAETRRFDGFSDGIGIYALDVRKDVLHQLGEG